MDTHDEVTCNKCLRTNFSGNRYKCLICVNFDLCQLCYESAEFMDSHSADHPVQCITTRAGVALFFGGEQLENPHLPQSYTCPCCGQMGFTHGALVNHAMMEHKKPNPYKVVCPLCATMPEGPSNYMTKDLASHLFSKHFSMDEDVDVTDSDTSVQVIMPSVSSNADGNHDDNAHGSGSLVAQWIGDNTDDDSSD